MASCSKTTTCPRTVHVIQRSAAWLFCFVVLWGRCLAARQMKERVQLAEPTGEANPRIEHVDFDPLVAELEQEQDDKAWLENYRRTRDMWTQGHTSEDDGDFLMEGEGSAMEAVEEFLEEEAEDGIFDDLGDGDPTDFGEEVLFNITDRIIKLFPLIDASPSDGRVSLDEMTAWHLKIAEQGSMHRTLREMEASDTNGDKQASLQEALSLMGVAEPDDESAKEQRDSYIDRFKICDLNKDGLLNVTEFHDFLHPEESYNQAVIQSLVREEMRRRDLDSDGKLNMEEFEMTTHHEVQHLTTGHSDPEMAAMDHFSDLELQENPEKAKQVQEEKIQGSFQSFDTNNDGFIDSNEFLPILKALWPSQRDFAVIHSKDITKHADGNSDGFLSLQEMLNHPHTFYQTVEDQEQPALHDEF